MELEITSKRENILLGRMEVEFRVLHEGEPTPSREALREALAKALHGSKETVVLDRLKSTFGMGLSEGYAKLYSNVETIKKVERPHILVRNGLAEKATKKAEAKPAASPAPSKTAPKKEAK